MGRARTFLLNILASGAPPATGDQIVVQTESGQALGTVMETIPALGLRRETPGDSPNKVVRKATQEDLATRVTQHHREQDAYRLALLKIHERGLEIKLTRVEQLFRELAAEVRTRIEMRQIGARDEAKMLSGYGSCGRPLCCSAWLNAFEPVSIKMAKQQDLSLNPSRLSGLCGRLKCCLRFELPNAPAVVHGGSGDEGGCQCPAGCDPAGCRSDGRCRA